MITQTKIFSNLSSIQQSIYVKTSMIKQITHATNLIRIGKRNAVAIKGISLKIAEELAEM